MIAAHLVHPCDINISWEDIAGLESLVQELRETVILPIQRKELFANSQLTTAPRGISNSTFYKLFQLKSIAKILNLLKVIETKHYNQFK